MRASHRLLRIDIAAARRVAVRLLKGQRSLVIGARDDDEAVGLIVGDLGESSPGCQPQAIRDTPLATRHPRKPRPSLIWRSGSSDSVAVVRVLIVEDDVRMAAAIRRALRGAGVGADVTTSGHDAQWMAVATNYDVIVLDVMLPDVDGFDTCAELRRAGVWTPIIMLTARDAVSDRVRGLDVGADDYLTKPFSLEELLARLRALARREGTERPSVMVVGTLKLDPASRLAWRGDTEIRLSAKEFALLDVFMRHAGQVLTQQQLLDAAWDFDYEHRSNVLEVYVRYLREKIDRPFGVQSLETVRSAGYRLRKDGGC